jgi:fluoroacetyl-CoA thioesterase
LKPTLKAGLSGTHSLIVDDARVIKFMGDDCQVYATPSIISDMEHACRELILAHLDAGEDSVGTKVDIEHVGPAVLGARITINAKVTAVDGRRIGFEAEVLCGDERILAGSHERFVVDALKVRERLLKKKAAQTGA